MTLNTLTRPPARRSGIQIDSDICEDEKHVMLWATIDGDESRCWTSVLSLPAHVQPDSFDPRAFTYDMSAISMADLQDGARWLEHKLGGRGR